VIRVAETPIATGVVPAHGDIVCDTPALDPSKLDTPSPIGRGTNIERERTRANLGSGLRTALDNATKLDAPRSTAATTPPDLLERGFASAGPNAVGLVMYPRWTPWTRTSVAHPEDPPIKPGLPETICTWGHCAVYVRIDDRIHIVRGFSVQNGPKTVALDWLTSGKIKTGHLGVPGAVHDDADIWRNTTATSLEFPVTLEAAEKLAASLPAAGPSDLDYTGAPGTSNGANGTNCLLWAIDQAESALGGELCDQNGTRVGSLGRDGGVNTDNASLGRVYEWVQDIIKGRTTAESNFENVVGPPVASNMPEEDEKDMRPGRIARLFRSLF